MQPRDTEAQTPQRPRDTAEAVESAMADRGSGDDGEAKDICDPRDISGHSRCCPVDAAGPRPEDHENRNSTSGGAEATAVEKFNRQLLRRPKRRPTTSDLNATDDPLPVSVEVELDAAFERSLPIASLPHPSFDESLKSEAFDDIRRLILDGTLLQATTPREQELLRDNEDIAGLVKEQEEEEEKEEEEKEEQEEDGVVDEEEKEEQEEEVVEEEEKEEEVEEEEEECSFDGKGQELFAVDSLRYFLRNMRFDDATMT